MEKDGISVKLIEKEHDRCLDLADQLEDAAVVCGDCSDQSLLESEHLDDCDALVTLTGLDELNIIVSLYGNSRGVPQIITKLGRMDNTRIVDDLPLGSVIKPKELCCNIIVRYVRAMPEPDWRRRLGPRDGRRAGGRRWNSSSTTRPVTAGSR